jgi:hypothetical protein
MTCYGIHHPKALSFFCQVFGLVGQQMSAADLVIAFSTGEVGKLICFEIFYL